MRGFSLIETVVSASLLAMVLLVIVSTLPSVYLVQNRGRYRLAAHQLAQSLLEERRALPFTALNVNSVTPLDPRIIDGTTIQLKPTLEVKAVSGHQPAHLLDVRVTVTWEFQSKTESVVHELRLLNLRR